MKPTFWFPGCSFTSLAYSGLKPGSFCHKFPHISSSYIGAIIILGLQSDQGTFVTEEIFAPLLTGAVFHLVWILVRSIFNDFISGNRWSSELVIGRNI